ncbi:MAG: cytochrome c maturation protein CcmE [Gammaproteobacteria bacterium]
MTNKQKKRMLQMLAILVAAGVGIACVLMALKESIQLYFTPSELVKAAVTQRQVVRMGGMIMADSIKREPKTLQVQFLVTDGLDTIPVFYEGVLPDLFREGQGVIVKGSYEAGKGFIASEVLTKHDERYVPKELQHTLKEPT